MEQKIETIKSWLGAGSVNLFGLPFAGKDTQATRLAEVFDGVVLSGGDILRHAKDNTELQEIMAAGGIIPSELFKRIVVPYLERAELAEHPLILSEVGRLRGEDEIILEATESSGHPTKAVVLLALADNEIWRRFDESQASHDRGSRPDDNRSVLQTRLDNYHSKVMPVIEFYRHKGLVIDIDGSLSREEVFKQIIEKLAERATSEQ